MQYYTLAVHVKIVTDNKISLAPDILDSMLTNTVDRDIFAGKIFRL